MIVFKKINGGKNEEVFLDGKHIGTIKKVKDGWSYFSEIQKTNGPVFKKRSICKKSLTWPFRPFYSKS